MKQCIYIGEYDIPASTSMPLNEAYDVEIDAACAYLPIYRGKPGLILNSVHSLAYTPSVRAEEFARGS